jgi:uncharacterized membrane protein YGL010W
VVVLNSYLTKLRCDCCVSWWHLQALTLAPLFVWFELLFLLGYRPGLYAELQKRVAADIARLKQKGA